jgi:hypothetical protein
MDFSSKSNLKAALGLDSTDVTDAEVDLLDGCGLAVFNSNYGNPEFNNTNAISSTATNIPTTNMALFCASCKPGYKADWFTDK